MAYELQNWTALLSAIESECTKSDGHWLWARRLDKSGYGRIIVAGRDFSAHRLVALAKRKGELDKRMSVHHTCAVKACCNPEHLQVVTPAENTAEMLERRYYLARIAELEAALHLLDPHHDALTSTHIGSNLAGIPPVV